MNMKVASQFFTYRGYKFEIKSRTHWGELHVVAHNEANHCPKVPAGALCARSNNNCRNKGYLRVAEKLGNGRKDQPDNPQEVTRAIEAVKKLIRSQVDAHLRARH
jgi:hypothetical protein